MSTAAPTIPPRPTRTQEAAASRGIEKLPEIPPRPLHKRLDRSVSPGNYPRSPLNEPWTPLSKTKSLNAPARDPIPRPPSVQHLPSIGQEGMEYGEIQYQPEIPVSALGADAAEQTRNIAEDLHLHAPKPSLPKSSATAQVQAVTRTDSTQAASHGLGKSPTPTQDEFNKHSSSDALGRIRSRASFSRPNSSASDGRRASVDYGEEQGPAELGMRVPINPLLGDVQAPSPAPFSPNHTGQNGEPKRRHHFRTKSGRDTAPPGSYGLHGHGVTPADPFEKDWYAKHPEELQHEEAHGHGVYEGIGSGRGAFALSSDDLNKIVRGNDNRAGGFGTSGNTMSYPDEQIGYLASDQYSAKSQPSSSHGLTKTLTNASQPAMESPLRKASVPEDDVDPVVQVRTMRSGSRKSDDATENPIHIDSPKGRYNKITGGEGTMNETRDPKPFTLDEDDQGYNVPILAADEVAKRGESEWLQPAVSPRLDRRGSAHDYDHRSGDNTPGNSRPSSRPGSIYGLHSASHSLSRFVSHHDDRDTMHTPLEDVDEYEPLFPDEETKDKAMTHAERFKQRPDGLKYRFPSQDIWEDAPNSVMHQAEVSTPDMPPSALFETPEAEAAGKGEKLPIAPDDFLTRSRPHLKNEVSRPGLQPRFPSSDVWEDSPDSFHQFTTVTHPQDEELELVEAASKPVIPPRPTGKSRLGEGTSSTQTAPSIPPRPQKMAHAVPPIDAKVSESTSPTKQRSPTELRKVPSIPDRPKPQVPPRPMKKMSGDSLSKVASKDSHDSNETERAMGLTSPPLAKAKPQVPARPAQAKFTGLKGNFMNDLNQKLGLGPPKEKEPEPEPEVEAKPLGDARKGRARGPQRRAPAKSPSAAPALAFSFSKPQSVFQIDDTGLLAVGAVKDSMPAEVAPSSEEETPVTLSTQKIEQVDHATVADAPLPISVNTEGKASSEEQNDLLDAEKSMEPSPAMGSSTEFLDPVGTPGLERSNPMSLAASTEAVDLSHQSTESSEGMAAHALEREVPNHSTDAIPASKQTTASTLDGSPLEQVETVAPEEPIKLQHEQVSASAPGPNTSMKVGSVESQTPQPAETVENVKNGSDAPKEPMPEDDVTYAQLEEMQLKADGKEVSDGGIKKVVD